MKGQHESLMTRTDAVIVLFHVQHASRETTLEAVSSQVDEKPATTAGFDSSLTAEDSIAEGSRESGRCSIASVR